MIMCHLFDKVASMLRACGVGWTAARIRYVRLYCVLRHLEGRRCAARRRDIGHCMAVVLADWEMRGTDGQPSRGLLQKLWLMEIDLITNGQASPYFSVAPPA